MSASRLLGLCCALLTLATGCGDDAVGAACPDAGVCTVDARACVMCKDTGPCRDLLATDLPATDLPVTDLPAPDMSAPDMPAPDQGTPSIPNETVLYVTGSAGGKLTAYTIKTDGTVKKAVSGLPASFSFLPMRDDSSPREYANVSRHRPMVMAQVDSTWRYLRLPNKLGQIYHLVTPTERGFLQVKPDGKVKVLDTIKGSSPTNQTYHSTVGARPDGTMFAAAYASTSKAAAGIRLIRTDGKTFSGNGKAVCDISPLVGTGGPGKAQMQFPFHDSYRYSAGHIYFVALYLSGTGYFRLYRAPLDCTAKATPVALPKVGGSPPSYYISGQLIMSEDRARLAVVAGHYGSAADIILVDTASGKATNLSESADEYEDPGYYVMHPGKGSQMLAISPKSTHAAWVKASFSSRELYVRRADRSKAAVHVTGKANFAAAVSEVRGLQWANDDALLFMAGTSWSYLDMYLYRPSTGAVTAITTFGGKTRPFSGFTSAAAGYRRPQGGWFSPNGKYIYFVDQAHHPAFPPRHDIKAMERATAKLIPITKDMNVYPGAGNIEASEGGGLVFFHGFGFAGNAGYQDLYYFDQDKAAPAVKMTSFKAGGHYMRISDIFPSPGGKMVAFSAGPDDGRSVYVGEVKPSPVVHKVDSYTAGGAAKQYIGDQKLLTTDGKALVYAAGGGAYKLTLRVRSIHGGKARVLDGTPGYTHVMAVYK